MDDITAVKPAAMPDAAPAPELPANDEPTLEPLDLVQEPKVRTKLRIYSILVALYVYQTLSSPSVSEHHLADHTSSSSSS